MKKNRTPRTEENLEKAFSDCEKRKRFREIEQESFSDYLERAQKDLTSAERDFQANDFHWAKIKAYQSLFYILNALLIKNLGYFSKDHGCVIIALMRKGIITDEIAKRLHLLMKNVLRQATSREIYNDIDNFRIQRNFALYKPKSWEDVKPADVRLELDKIKENFKILVELL